MKCSACSRPIAQPAVAAPIALVVGPTTVQVKPAVIAQNLTFNSVGRSLVPVVNSQGIVASLGANAFSALETPSKNASFDVRSGTPVIVPSVEGGTADVRLWGRDLGRTDPARAAQRHRAGEGYRPDLQHCRRRKAWRQEHGEHVHHPLPVLRVAGDEHPHDREHRERRHRSCRARRSA